MKTNTNPTAEDLLIAELYWKEKEFQVKRIAKQMGLEIEVTWDYLYDLFDYGDLELTDRQVREELEKDFA